MKKINILPSRPCEEGEEQKNKEKIEQEQEKETVEDENKPSHDDEENPEDQMEFNFK